MASRSASSLCLVLIFLISLSEGKEFWLEGHQNTWKIPSVADEFTHWAQKLRFQIGDAIVVHYDPKSDSILEVSKGDHDNCSKLEPIKRYEDGNTTLSLERSGWYYFISGVDGHCEKGQRLAVDVLSKKHSSNHSSSAPSTPSPYPTPSNPWVQAPAPAPSTAFQITTTFLASFTFLLTTFFALATM